MLFLSFDDGKFLRQMNTASNLLCTTLAKWVVLGFYFPRLVTPLVKILRTKRNMRFKKTYIHEVGVGSSCKCVQKRCFPWARGSHNRNHSSSSISKIHGDVIQDVFVRFLKLFASWHNAGNLVVEWLSSMKGTLVFFRCRCWKTILLVRVEFCLWRSCNLKTKKKKKATMKAAKKLHCLLPLSEVAMQSSSSTFNESRFQVNYTQAVSTQRPAEGRAEWSVISLSVMLEHLQQSCAATTILIVVDWNHRATRHVQW